MGAHSPPYAHSHRALWGCSMVVFTQAHDEVAELNAWSHDLSTVLSKVERTCRLIEKVRAACSSRPLPLQSAPPHAWLLPPHCIA